MGKWRVRLEEMGGFEVEELRSFPLFEGLEIKRLQNLLQEHRTLQMPAQHQLVFQGDWNDGLFLIRSGVVKVRRLTLQGEEVVIALLGAGEMFGELAMLLGNSRRTADVVALTPLEVVKLRWTTVQQELDHSTGFALEMARLQARRLLSLGRRFSLRGEDATTRVLATLLELAFCSGYGNDPLAPIPDLKQTEIAAIAGLARGTTSRILTQLRSRGTIVESAEGLRLANLEPLRRRGLLEP
jgi:CRP/FNR family cyclic AMP-dependent transcriptional regulator